MTTPRTAAHVSLAAALLALGACARRPALPAPVGGATAALAARAFAVPFDNGGREHVHVYLIGERREWLLGRVEPGARAMLRIPEASFVAGQGFVRLAVLAGRPMTAAAAREPRATFTVRQPAGALLSQGWTFAQGQLTALQRP
jgi:hypothetical protein